MRGVFWLVTLLWLAGCGSPPAAAQGGRSVDQVRTSGSLRGSDLDGGWVVARLQTDPALTRRFDHLLTALGEVDVTEIRRWIGAEVTRQHGPATAAQVLLAWDEHLARLQNKTTPGQEGGNNYPANPPQKTVRNPPPLPRAVLLPEPSASAEQLQALHTQRVAKFGPEAAERLRAEDAARWAWSHRLAQARSQLQTVPEAEREAHLQRQFSGSELLRARALLGLPP
jgi:Proteobacterial lipase chaperone protein